MSRTLGELPDQHLFPVAWACRAYALGLFTPEQAFWWLRKAGIDPGSCKFYLRAAVQPARPGYGEASFDRDFNILPRGSYVKPAASQDLAARPGARRPHARARPHTGRR